MRGKRILAWICALCVCMGLTGCAMSVDLEGMSAEELAELEAAATEKLEERRQIDLDAMSDEELEALAAQARERLESMPKKLNFDELIALRDEVEKRLGPAPEVTPSEDVLVIEGTDKEKFSKIYYGGKDIPLGTWFATPLPRGLTFFYWSDKTDGLNTNNENIMLDGRTGGGLLSEDEVTVTENTIIIPRNNPIILKRQKSEQWQCKYDGTDVISAEKLDAMDKAQLEALYYDIHMLLYANALEYVDDKWATDETVRMEAGVWYVGKDIPAGEWTVQAGNESVFLFVYMTKEAQIEQRCLTFIAPYEDEKKKILFMPDTWIELSDTTIFSRE